MSGAAEWKLVSVQCLRLMEVSSFRTRMDTKMGQQKVTVGGETGEKTAGKARERAKVE